MQSLRSASQVFPFSPFTRLHVHTFLTSFRITPLSRQKEVVPPSLGKSCRLTSRAPKPLQTPDSRLQTPDSGLRTPDFPHPLVSPKKFGQTPPPSATSWAK